MVENEKEQKINYSCAAITQERPCLHPHGVCIEPLYTDGAWPSRGMAVTGPVCGSLVSVLEGEVDRGILFPSVLEALALTTGTAADLDKHVTTTGACHNNRSMSQQEHVTTGACHKREPLLSVPGFI